MKTLSIVLASTAAVAIAATAYAHVASPPVQTTPSADGDVARGDVSSEPSGTASRPAEHAAPALVSNPPSALDYASVEDPSDYGIMIQHEGRGIESCGEEISELATIGREIYAGCMAAAGYDAHADFKFQAGFELDDEGKSHLKKLAIDDPTDEAQELAQCLVDGFFDDPDAEHLPGFSGRLTFTFNPLDETQTSPSSIAQRVAQRDPQEIPTNDLAWRGSKDAATTIVACVDPDCPFTRRAAPTIDRLLDERDGELRIAQLQSPQPMHEGAQRKSQALVVAQRHDLYWEAADYLHMHPGAMHDADFEALAKEIGLDEKAFLAALDGDAAVREVARQREACQDAGAHATPTFFIDGHRMAGARPYEAFQAAIEAVKD